MWPVIWLRGAIKAGMQAASPAVNNFVVFIASDDRPNYSEQPLFLLPILNIFEQRGISTGTNEPANICQAGKEREGRMMASKWQLPAGSAADN